MPAAYRSLRRRSIRLSATISILVLLAAIGLRAAPATAQVQVETALDLPAMTLTPADLEDEGLDGFGLGFGQTMFAEEFAAGIAESRGVDLEEILGPLEEAGFTRRYDSFLFRPTDASDPTGPAAQVVVSYALGFTAAGAADAFTFLEDESDDPTAEDVDLENEIGDEAEVTRSEGEDPATGLEFIQLDLTFRVGNLHAGLALVDWEGNEPDQEVVETLAARLLDRVEGVVAGEAPNLGSRALRLAGDGVLSSVDSYRLIEGAAVHASDETVEAAEARAEFAAEIENTDSYRVHFLVAEGSDSPDDDVWFLLDLLAFADEDAAQTWLDGAEERIAGNENLTEFTIDDEAPTIGDASIAFTAQTSDGLIAYRSVTLRVGATLAFIDVYGPEAPPAAAIAELAEAQAVCLAGRACPQPLAVPDDLAEYIAGLADGDAESGAGRRHADEVEGGTADDGTDDSVDDEDDADTDAAATETAESDPDDDEADDTA